MKIRKEDTIDLTNPEDPQLRAMLDEQSISLKPNELSRVRVLLDRDPTLVELHIFNVMWSEHCSYKSSRPLLKKHLPTKAPHVVLGPGEDAGIIRFFERNGRSYCLVLAHESHNHPSQVLPVEGAATGIGGIVRDVYCMGADVIGVMDPLRFGNPDGPNGKRVWEIVRGVVDGIAQYGNALGVPNYGGDTYFDQSYDDNCLVNVIALGVVAEEDIIRSRAPKEAADEQYDIILVGKPTDASGFGGAAFASGRLSGDQAEERQEAVQLPDPFLKRVLAEATKVVLREAKKRGVKLGFKDLGAGGISCAISEMAQAGGVGAVVDLDRVKVSMSNLSGQVIACSETQERYAMFTPRDFTDVVCRIYNEEFELPHLYPEAGAYVIGQAGSDKQFRLMFRERVVCDAHVDAITTGIEYKRETRERKPPETISLDNASKIPSLEDALLRLLSTYNIADKSVLFKHYDSEVQGRAVLRPGEADAAVAMFLPGETVAVAAGIGGNSSVAQADPYFGGVWAVVEAVRNVSCVGATALAMTDCLNYGDPEDHEVFWDFAEGVRGIGDACRAIRIYDDPDQGIPIVSGNVSFYNQSGNGLPIAPTPIVSCAGRVDDASKARGMGFKKSGSRIVLLGVLHNRLGGSEYAKQFFPDRNFEVPVPDFDNESALIRTLRYGFESGEILSAHDISHGGVLVTIAEMMVMSAPALVGCRFAPDALPDREPAASYLFSEYGGVVVEVDSSKWPEFEKRLGETKVVWTALGETTESPTFSLRVPGQTAEVKMEKLREAIESQGKVCGLFA